MHTGTSGTTGTSLQCAILRCPKRPDRPDIRTGVGHSVAQGVDNGLVNH